MRPALSYYIHVLLLHLVACIDYDGWINIKIEHSLNCGNHKFCPRGNISLKSIRSGSSIIDQMPFNYQHLAELQELADIDGFYSVKTFVTSADKKESEFLSSVKAKTYLENGLTDIINAWVLPNGAVIAINFQVSNTSNTKLQQGKNLEHRLQSKFYLRYVDQAPVPDTASFIQKLERERDAREKGDVKDNKSFLAKYWIYIVPLAIFVMISGATNPESGAPATR